MAVSGDLRIWGTPCSVGAQCSDLWTHCSLARNLGVWSITLLGGDHPLGSVGDLVGLETVGLLALLQGPGAASVAPVGTLSAVGDRGDHTQLGPWPLWRACCREWPFFGVDRGSPPRTWPWHGLCGGRAPSPGTTVITGGRRPVRQERRAAQLRSGSRGALFTCLVARSYRKLSKWSQPWPMTEATVDVPKVLASGDFGALRRLPLCRPGQGVQFWPRGEARPPLRWTLLEVPGKSLRLQSASVSPSPADRPLPGCGHACVLRARACAHALERCIGCPLAGSARARSPPAGAPRLLSEARPPSLVRRDCLCVSPVTLSLLCPSRS